MMPTKPFKLSPNVFKGGISEKRLGERAARQAAAAGGGDQLRYKVGDTRLVQFFGEPTDTTYFLEFAQHQFKAGNTWNYIPCAGEDSPDCEPCQSEDDSKSKIHNRLICVVWSFKDRAVKILEGPNALSQNIFHQWKRAPERFLKRTYEITKLNTQPVGYSVDRGEERPIDLSNKEPLDLNKYLVDAMQKYYAGISSRPSTLDDDEDEDIEDEEMEDNEEEPEEDEMLDKDAYSWSDLKEYAREVGVRSDTKSRSELVKLILHKRA